MIQLYSTRATVCAIAIVGSCVAGCANSTPRAPKPAPTTAVALEESDAATSQAAKSLAAINAARAVVVANMANADKTGFKRSTASVNEDGQVVVGIDCEQGSLDRTERVLDIGISGEGFLMVKHDDSPSGIAFTRNGNLFVDPEGMLVLSVSQDKSVRLDPPIRVPQSATDITIAQDGSVHVLMSGTTIKRMIGQLQLSRFVNPEGLAPLADSFYLATGASGPAKISAPGEDGRGQVLQGFLEHSNVDVNREQLRMAFLDEWKAATLKAVPAVKR